MTSEDISPAIRQFLHDYVETYEQLEILLLFGRDGYLSCGAANAADQLNLTVSVAADTLDQLALAGLLSRAPSGPGAVFAVRPEQLAIVESLGTAYRLNRLAVMHLLTENAMERVRTSALRTLAAAFLLGKKHDG